MELNNYIPLIVILLHVCFATWAIAHALIYKNDHIVALGWVGTCLFFPIFGSLAYFIFGINRIKTRAIKIRNRAVSKNQINESISDINIIKNSALPPQAIAVAHLSYSNRFLLRNNNHIEYLINGEEAYPKMINAIDCACDFILLSTYIFENDETGLLFVEALSRAKERGVKTYILIDGLGVKYGKKGIIRSLKKKGIKAYQFLKVRLIPPSLYFNLRNHRKLLIVDGVNGFTGGMNISNNHCINSTNNKLVTQDIHFKLTGEILEDLIKIFQEDWEFSSHKKILLPKMKTPQVVEKTICRAFSDGPNEDIDVLPLLLNGVISCATKSIQIITPYFLPSRELISALKAASMRGVVVNIILPQINNIRFVNWASQKCFSELVRFNINIYYQPPPFAHTKIFMIDDYYSIIGSANLDPRSLYLNFEAVIEIYDIEFSKKLNTYVNNVIIRSQKIDQEWFNQQNIFEKLRNGFFWLFSSFL